jgi:hypothetical protein
MRKKFQAALVAGIFAASIATVSPNAFALGTNNYPLGDERPSIAAMGMDFLIVRPLSFAVTVGGGVFWFLTLPVSAIGGNVGEAGDKLFLEPGRYTFVRPLGHMQLDNSPVLGDR